ncbi:kinase-like domain-containing protein [Favolaschia claudopus]|uniref:Kinase-like domain-containing protein n=1 Tax=Favolaschia claudopus TaxID=2862362 RepID=A0AAW0BQP6_9AGAR
MSSDYLGQLTDSLAHDSFHPDDSGDVYVKTCDAEDLMGHNERHVYSGLGPHPRILKCLNPTDWTIPIAERVSPNEPLRFPKAPKGDLQQYLWNHPDPPFPLRVKWIHQIAEGLEFIHTKGFFWADCTPANMLLTNNLDILLCDFGASTLITERAFGVLPGLYMKPGADFSGDYFRSTKVDIYAFGCVVLELITHGVIDAETEAWNPEFFRGGHTYPDSGFLLIDLIPTSLVPFKAIVESCWDLYYPDGRQLFAAVKDACTQYESETQSSANVE